MLAVAHERDAVDEREVVAVGLLDPATRPVGEVVDELGSPQLEAVVVDDVEVGEGALDESAPIGEAEQVGALRAQLPDALLQPEAGPLPNPAGEEVGGLAGVLDLAAVRPRVT